MPIYEYECRKCKAHIEVFQKVSDKPPSKCRKCRAKLERKVSAPAIHFMVSGWYVTDYASKKTKIDNAESDSVSEKKSETTEKKTKESSPAKKTSEKSSSPKASSGD